MKIIFNYKIVPIVAILFLFKQLNTYIILWKFLFLHEIGHIIVIKILKLQVNKMYITPLGFNIKLKNEPKNLTNRLWLEATGLIMNAIILIIGIILKDNTVIIANLIIIILNIIPIYPLDGSRILKTILEYKLSKTKSEIIINKISMATVILFTALSSIIILKFHNFIIIIALCYLWCMVIKENRKMQLKRRIDSIIKHNRVNN